MKGNTSASQPASLNEQLDAGECPWMKLPPEKPKGVKVKVNHKTLLARVKADAKELTRARQMINIVGSWNLRDMLLPDVKHIREYIRLNGSCIQGKSKKTLVALDDEALLQEWRQEWHHVRWSMHTRVQSANDMLQQLKTGQGDEDDE